MNIYKEKYIKISFKFIGKKLFHDIYENEENGFFERLRIY